MAKTFIHPKQKGDSLFLYKDLFSLLVLRDLKLRYRQTALGVAWILLLIDEALAIGDASFQARGIEKIKTTQKEDKSIVLVSHQLDWIEKLCPRTRLLHHGTVD